MLKLSKKEIKQIKSSDWQTCYKLAEQAYEMADYEKAEYVLNQSITKTPSLSFSIEATITFNKIGFVLYRLARYKEALEMFKSQIERCKLLLKDIDHPLVAEHISKSQIGHLQALLAQNFNGLALTYQMQGKYKEAEKLLQQALELQKEHLISDHPDIAQTLNNLGFLYAYDMERYIEAEKLHKEALEIRRNVFGEEHIRVAESLHNLGMIYGYHQAEYSEGESLYKQAIAIKEKLLGNKHPSTAWSYTFLALLSRRTISTKEARALLNTAIRIFKKKLGLLHPDLAEAITSLGLINLEDWRFKQATALFTQAFEIYKTTLGENHWYTATLLQNLGTTAYQQRQSDIANGYYKQSVEIFKKVLGPNDTKLASAMNGVATVFLNNGNYKEAEKILVEAIKIYENVHLKGKPKDTIVADPSYSRVVANLAHTYNLQAKYLEAKLAYEKAIKSGEALQLATNDDLEEIKDDYKSFLRYAQED